MSTSFFTEQATSSDYKYNNMTLDLNRFIDLDVFSINNLDILENAIFNNFQYNIQQTSTEPIREKTKPSTNNTLLNTIYNKSIYKKKRNMKEICCINNCTFSQFKHNLCRIHYYKENNLLCSIENCNNLKRKTNLCYKHIKPLCNIKYCKCYALSTDILCKKHKQNKTINSQKNVRFI